MGKRSRDKGQRAERDIVARCREIGLPAQKVPLSGACEGYRGDVVVAGLRCEVKARGNGQGFAVLERWLGENDILFLRRDRAEPLIVLPWATWQRLMRPGSAT